MKKIVIVTDVTPISVSGVTPDSVSGVSTSIDYAKRGLEKRGFEVILIHPKLFLNFRLPYYKDVRLAFVTKRKIEKLLTKIQPDYVHIATEGPLGFVVRSVCVDHHWKFTTSYHTRLPEYVDVRLGSLKEVTYQYLRWFHSKSKKVMVTTPSLKKELEKRKFRNVVSFPLGVDVELFKRNPNAKLPTGLIHPVFVYLGRVSPEKNIQAFLKCRLPGSKLVIGDGPARKELEKRFKGKALFVGFKKGQPLVDLLSSSDVFVFPSKTDTFGLVMIEALACGLPVAAYNVQGPKDIVVKGVNGYLDANLATSAKKCLTLDRKVCEKSAQPYSWDNYVAKFIKTLVRV